MESCSSDQHVFVYLRTRPELLRYLDRLRELIKFEPFEEEQSRSCSLRMTKFLFYKERASQQICIHRFTDFTVLKALVGR